MPFSQYDPATMTATRIFLLLVITALGAAAFPATAAAQLSTYRLEIRKAEVVDDTYTIFFSLLGSSQQAIKEVDLTTLTVLDADQDGKELSTSGAEVKLLTDRTDRNVAIMFVVANYRAFNDKNTNSRTAVKEFVQRVRSNGDIVGMVTYGTSYKDTAFSPDVNAVAQQVESLSDSDEGEPRIIRALNRATNRFAQDLDQQQIDLKYMVIISDGAGAWIGRTDSAFVDQRTNRLASKLEELGVVPIVVGYGPLLGTDEPGLQFLKQLASQANGTYREAEDKEDVLNLTDAAYNEIYGSHVLTFTGGGLTSGEQHKIRLAATVDAQKLKSPPYQLYIPEGTTNWKLWGGIAGGLCLLIGLIGGVVFGVVMFVRSRKKVDEEEDMYYEPGPQMAPAGVNMQVAGQVAPSMVQDDYVDTPPAQYHGKLYAKSGPLHGRNYYVTEKVVTMGSAESNQIILNDGTISKKHAGIRIKNERFEVHDFGSTNGVFINGRRVSQQYLKDGDVIKMGDTELEFTLK